MVRWPSLMLVPALVAVALAGCASEPSEDAPAPPATVEERARDLVPAGAVRAGGEPQAAPDANVTTAPVANATAAPAAWRSVAEAPWWLLAVDATADGGLAGYRWTIPEGALQEHEDVEDWQLLTLEVGPIVADDAQATEFSIWAFALDGGEARPVATYVSTPLRFESRFLVTPTEDVVQTDPEPFIVQLLDFDDDLEAGDQIGFVLEAKGAGTFGAAMRVLEEDDFRHEASDSTEELLEELVATGQGAALTPHGTGTGAQYALYFELDFGLLGLAGPGLNSYTMSTDAVTASHALPDARPFAWAQETTVATAFAKDGWGMGYGMLLQGDVGAARVEFDVRSQGQAVQGTTATLGTPAAGLPAFYYVMGDGTGGTSVSVRALGADTNAYRFLGIEHVDFGASLKTLVGTAAREQATGPIVLSAQGHDLVVQVGGCRQVIAGALRPVA